VGIILAMLRACHGARRARFLTLALALAGGGCAVGAVAWGAAQGLQWTAGDGHRRAPLAPTASDRVGFSALPPLTTAVGFTNTLPESRHITNQILLNGAGVAAGDVDGDGCADLYFCASYGTNRLLRNLGGWRFEAVPDAGGAGCAWLTSTGAAFADLDGDGDLDLVVNTLGNGSRVFLNDGRGKFTSFPGVLNPQAGAMSVALGDVDGDGFLDLYVANYRMSALMDMPSARVTFRTVDGRQQIETFTGRAVTEPDLTNRFSVGPRGEIEESGDPDVLYLNQRGTNFILQPFDQGAFLDEEGRPLPAPLREWGLSAMFRDLNQDGRPDLYVCNDFHTPDRLWINQGQGRFRLIPRLALRHTSQFSMAVDFADVNRDGFDDFFVLDMMSRDHLQRMRYVGDRPPDDAVVRGELNRPQYGHNVLFLNRGNLTFAEIAQLGGVEASEWSWACAFVDVDLDGFEDLLVANGMERAARDLDTVERLRSLRTSRRMSDREVFEARRMFPRLATPNLAFRNGGDLTFTEMGHRWGFDASDISQGMALADLDNDGDLDVVVNNLNAPAGLYRNETAAPRVAVRLKGRFPNTRGIGARIQLFGAAASPQSQEMIAGGRYLSGDDPIRTFAAATSGAPLRLEVRWPSGAITPVAPCLPNHLYEVEEPAPPVAAPQPSEAAARPAPLFEDVSARLNHVHQDEPFDDFLRQSLLPHKLSRAGPGVAWGDFDGDGDDDLVVGAGRGGRLACFLNDGQGGFQRRGSALGKETVGEPALTRDVLGLLLWPQPDGKKRLLTASSHYEDGLAEGPAVRDHDLSTGEVTEVAPTTESSVGPLAMADVDGNGELDLFIGGRVIPGRYPEAATSRLLRREGGQFRSIPADVELLRGIGLVSAAVFADLDADGDPDLVLACEWGPVRLLRNQAGRFRDETEAWQLAGNAGWWNGVAVGDLDEDGRLDLVASNWGRNSKYQAHRDQPLRLYSADFDGDNYLELTESWYDSALSKYVPVHQRDALARALPALRARFPSHRAYSTAGIEEVLGNALQGCQLHRATWLESTVFFNRSDHFEARALPVEAQFAPAFGVCVTDADGDGHEDVFLAQNFFSPQLDTSRYDAGCGLWLMGDGRGGFRAIPVSESGVFVPGEGRAAAVADFDQDGRVDLVVGQNSGKVRLFRNLRSTPGLRVRLKGPAGNPAGFGAAARLMFGQRGGPWREFHLGSGFLSQDAATQVLATPHSPSTIEVRWPWGNRESWPIPASAAAVEIDAKTGVRVVAEHK
jgi:hypothetical protein